MNCADCLYFHRHRPDIYDMALNKWGFDKQMTMVMEECGELLSALGKVTRDRVAVDDVITELADVSIMVEQMAQYFGWYDFQKERVRKLKRLAERLEYRKEGSI